MDILMPQLGETVAEGTVTKWYKQAGEAVKADEALFDVETDKVSTEIPCPVAGIVAEILVPAGQTVKVGTRLAVVASGAQAELPLAPPALRETAAAPVSSARALATPHALARVPGQKLSPVVRRLLAEHGLAPGDVRGTGRDGRLTRDDVLGHVGRASATPTTAVTNPGAPPAAARTSVASAPALPVTAPTPVPAPAPAITSGQAAPVPAQPPAVPAPSVPGEGETFVPFNTIRRKTATAMARAWAAVPHVLQAVEADFSRVEAARRARGDGWRAREGFALTYLPFIALAVSHALGRYPHLNARIEGEGLMVSRRVHLGIAVDLSHEGLMVPVVRDAQDRTLPALAREIHRLAQGARAGRLRPDDFATPTYTLSNSGVFGTLITAPIVNPPQVGILSTDGVRKKPVVIESPDGDAIAIRPVGVLAQSFDHRAIDGAYSAAFLAEVRRVIETRDWLQDLPA